jgi:hypothetical protein
MEKFKNELSVKGDIHYLIAFKSDLNKIGYNLSVASGEKNTATHVVTYKHGVYGFYNHAGIGNSTILALPQDWQKALELAAEVEEVGPEFKNGDYVVYINKTGCRMSAKEGAIAIVNENREYLDVKWICYKSVGQHDGGYHHDDFRLATHEEIEAYLIEEAKNKGFVVGGEFYDQENRAHSITGYKLITSKKGGSTSCEIHFASHGIHLALKYGIAFAVPVDLCTLKAKNPTIQVNGYKAKFEDWGLNFNGCAKIHKEAFIEAQEFITKVNSLSNVYGEHLMNRTVTSIKIGKGEFTPQQIEEIVKHYQEKEAK